VTDPQQVKDLAPALAQNLIETINITDQGELNRVAQLSAFLGMGESTAIAVAESRGWIVGMDEKGRALREVNNGPAKNRLITTPGILLTLIRDGTITVQDADAMKLQLETQRFKMDFGSFADLV
jgi:predicted nucleic acid-binding protein